GLRVVPVYGATQPVHLCWGTELGLALRVRQDDLPVPSHHRRTGHGRLVVVPDVPGAAAYDGQPLPDDSDAMRLPAGVLHVRLFECTHPRLVLELLEQVTGPVS